LEEGVGVVNQLFDVAVNMDQDAVDTNRENENSYIFRFDVPSTAEIFSHGCII
jgi:hypothetical protein